MLFVSWILVEVFHKHQGSDVGRTSIQTSSGILLTHADALDKTMHSGIVGDLDNGLSWVSYQGVSY